MFQPGQSGNPAGRKRGARNKRTLAAETKIEAVATTDETGRKVVDPLILLSTIVSNTDANLALRISAASALAQKLVSRLS